MTDANSLLDYGRKVENAIFSEIPIIDLQHARSPDFALRRKIADDIRRACLTVGFFYIKNHGVPEELATAAIENAKPFWDLPPEKKSEYAVCPPLRFKGYNGFLTQNVDSDNHGDLHEGYIFGWEEDDDDKTRLQAEGSTMGENIWPADFPDFRKASLKFHRAMGELGQVLFSLFALALDLPENFFNDKITNPGAATRILHYPPQTGEVDDSVLGIGAHTDYVAFECFTILWQDDHKALQVLNSEGKWIDVVPIPGTFVVNIADQLSRWTNDLFKSTVHRAVNRTGQRRYSMPTFFGTDHDVVIETLPSCVSEERPAKYEPIKVGHYLRLRVAASYARSASKE